MSEQMTQGELYLVKLLYRDAPAWKKYTASKELHPELPTDKRAERYVAVFPGMAGDPVHRAADLACERVIGGRESWNDCLPIIESVQMIGSVYIEEPTP